MHPARNSRIRIISCSLVVLVALLCAAWPAKGQVAIGTCRPNMVHFDNFDDAVHGVPPGETILVCPGVYQEQVSISTSLTIKGITDGVNGGLPVLVPPASGLAMSITSYSLPFSFTRGTAIAAQILVNPGNIVNISGIALDATNSLLVDCTLFPVGIYYQDASGTVNHVAFKNQISPCNTNGSFTQGEGVLVQSNGVLQATVTVENSSIVNSGLMGIEANGDRNANGDVFLTVQGNTIVGPGNNQGNGIYTTFANNNITGNDVTNALHTGEPTGYFGIITQCSPTFTAANNRVSNTLVGIYVTNAPAPCGGVGNVGYAITGNHVYNSETNGVEVCGPANLIQNNLINGSGVAGVSLDDAFFNQACGSQANAVANNTIDGACAAVLEGPANVGEFIGPDAIFNSKFLLQIGTTCQ